MVTSKIRTKTLYWVVKQSTRSHYSTTCVTPTISPAGRRRKNAGGHLLPSIRRRLAQDRKRGEAGAREGGDGGGEGDAHRSARPQSQRGCSTNCLSVTLPKSKFHLTARSGNPAWIWGRTCPIKVWRRSCSVTSIRTKQQSCLVTSTRTKQLNLFWNRRTQSTSLVTQQRPHHGRRGDGGFRPRAAFAIPRR